MEIIVLKGASNTGKSQTLNIVYQYLLLFGYIQIHGHFRVLGNPANNDCIDILEKKGRRIGIAMMGDYEKGHAGDTVQELLAYLQNNKCGKAICACNSNLNQAIAFISKYKNVFIDKNLRTNAADERIVNGDDAERIYRLI